MKTMMLRLMAGGALILLVGCAQTYRFKVDALAEPAERGSGTFAIEPAAGEKPMGQLRYREAADYVGRALTSRGWTQASNPETADLIVSLEASVSEPLNQSETWMEPVYGRTWPRTTVVRTPVRREDGKIGYVATRIYIPSHSYFAGYRDYERNYIVYEKTLDLTARDRRSGEEVWTIEVQTVDRSSDLRTYIPLLTAAALPYVGETTEGSVVVRVKEDDEAVQFLRGVAPATAG